MCSKNVKNIYCIYVRYGFLGMTFPDFELAPKRNEKFGYCGLDLVERR